MRPALESEKPKSIMRRTAIGTTSVAAEARASAISASTIRPRWARAYGASGFNAARETRDLLLPVSVDDISQAAPEAIRGLRTPFRAKNQGGRDRWRLHALGPACVGRPLALYERELKEPPVLRTALCLFCPRHDMKSHIHPHYQQIKVVNDN